MIFICTLQVLYPILMISYASFLTKIHLFQWGIKYAHMIAKEMNSKFIRLVGLLIFLIFYSNFVLEFIIFIISVIIIIIIIILHDIIDFPVYGNQSDGWKE